METDDLCGYPIDNKNLECDDSLTCSTDEGILECDYDTQVTKLYHCIEERKWEEVLFFLEAGKWYNTSIFGSFGDQAESPSIQTRTWVTALDESGNIRWCQLPLHAAVTFLAPFSVICKLIEVYPMSVRCADDQNMLPLHYAFRFGAEDDVLAHLLEKFPQALGKAAVKDRLPLDLAQYGPRPERGKIIDIFMRSAVRNAQAKWNAEQMGTLSTERSNAEHALQQKLNEKNNTLTKLLDECTRTKKELRDLKEDSSCSMKGSCGIACRASKGSLKSKASKNIKSMNGKGQQQPRKQQSGNDSSAVQNASRAQSFEQYPDTKRTRLRNIFGRKK